MAEPIVRFEKPPTLTFREPLCSACIVELEHDDGWTCPTCGTAWDYSASDDTPGTLYVDWSGEESELSVSDPEDAWMTTINADAARRESERLAQNQRAAIVRAERERKAASDG